MVDFPVIMLNTPEITDGTSNTFAVGERCTRLVRPPAAPNGGQWAGVWAGFDGQQLGPVRKDAVLGHTFWRMQDGSNLNGTWGDVKLIMDYWSEHLDQRMVELRKEYKGQ